MAHRWGRLNDRLRTVALPACALIEPAVPGCASGGQVLPGRNDTSADQLLVPLADPAAMDVLAVTAGPGGELEGSGDFKATPLELSSDWDVGVGSGELTWTYDVPVPAAPAGSAPRSR
jgi:hypothetical protein